MIQLVDPETAEPNGIFVLGYENGYIRIWNLATLSDLRTPLLLGGAPNHILGIY